MTESTHTWAHNGTVVTFYWLEDADVNPDRVYAFAFTPDKKMLLVTDPHWRPAGWLPGGGTEYGETPEEALARELAEEANASVHQHARIGAQCAEDAEGRRSYHVFYWCRITLHREYAPRHEVSERFLVRPEEFLDRLFWGHSDPKARVLLERALEMEKGVS